MKKSLLLITAILLFACNSKNEQELEQTVPGDASISFYHWKTTLELTDKENEVLKQFGSDRLYLRFFDVSYVPGLEQSLPKATIQIPDDFEWKVNEVVPVVYITNDVFTNLKYPSNINRLSLDIFNKINRLKSKMPGVTIPEIQIDCDWTVTSKENYFAFLEAFRERLDTQDGTDRILLTATLRLHQVKYPEKIGVPPVDKAVLMLYNMGDLADVSEPNSILNLETTKQYLGRLDNYPLQMVIAYPFYEWGVLYRNDELSGILSHIDKEILEINFEAAETHNVFKAKNDLYINKTFIYNIMQIRVIHMKKM